MNENKSEKATSIHYNRSSLPFVTVPYHLHIRDFIRINRFYSISTFEIAKHRLFFDYDERLLYRKRSRILFNYQSNSQAQQGIKK